LRIAERRLLDEYNLLGHGVEPSPAEAGTEMACAELSVEGPTLAG
jgi:hypothetical protein